MTAPRARSTLAVQAVLLVAMAVWGVNLSAVKALTASLDIMLVATARMVVAAAALSLLAWPARRRLVALDARALGRLALCALLMVYANQILFASGLARTSATNAAIVMSLSPLVSSIVASVLLRERLGAQRLCGIAVGFGGVALVVLNRPGAAFGGGWAGDLLLLSSVACFALGGAMVQRLSRALSAVEISWVVHVIGAAMLALQVAFDGAPVARPLLDAGPQAWGLVLFSGIGATAFAAVAWNRAIARIGVARTAMWFYWVPVFGLGFAALALGEPLTAAHALGLAGVVAGSMMALRAPHRAAAERV